MAKASTILHVGLGEFITVTKSPDVIEVSLSTNPLVIEKEYFEQFVTEMQAIQTKE